MRRTRRRRTRHVLTPQQRFARELAVAIEREHERRRALTDQPRPAEWICRALREGRWPYGVTREGLERAGRIEGVDIDVLYAKERASRKGLTRGGRRDGDRQPRRDAHTSSPARRQEPRYSPSAHEGARRPSGNLARTHTKISGTTSEEAGCQH